jgi:hypothetical protein
MSNLTIRYYRLAYVLAALVLSGCAAQQAAEMDAQCKSYGAKPGTPAYINCRAQLDAAHEQAAATMLYGGQSQNTWYTPTRIYTGR